MKRRTVKRILTYVRPYRAAFAASCASALLYVLFTLLGPVFTGRAIDNILGPGQVDLRGVLYYLALLGISVLLAAASQWVMNVCTRKISSRASNDMRGEAFRVLNRTPLKYIDSHPHGDIISRMINDAELVAEGPLQGLTQLLPGVATILGTLGDGRAEPFHRAGGGGGDAGVHCFCGLRCQAHNGLFQGAERCAGPSVGFCQRDGCRAERRKGLWLRGPLFRTVRRHQR